MDKNDKWRRYLAELDRQLKDAQGELMKMSEENKHHLNVIDTGICAFNRAMIVLDRDSDEIYAVRKRIRKLNDMKLTALASREAPSSNDKADRSLSGSEKTDGATSSKKKKADSSSCDQQELEEVLGRILEYKQKSTDIRFAESEIGICDDNETPEVINFSPPSSPVAEIPYINPTDPCHAVWLPKWLIISRNAKEIVVLYNNLNGHYRSIFIRPITGDKPKAIELDQAEGKMVIKAGLQNVIEDGFLTLAVYKPKMDNKKNQAIQRGGL